MVRHAAREYGVRALGVTLSREQAEWAKEAIDREGLGDLAEVRHLDYRDVRGDRLRRGQLDRADRAHRGAQLPGVLRASCATGSRPGAGCSTTASPGRTTGRQETGAFIDRYVFPDGELTGSGTDHHRRRRTPGLEVRHEENLRLPLRARPCAGWCRNLVENWDECVAEVGEGTARVWGLYMAGSRLGFERNEIQLHQVLGDPQPRRRRGRTSRCARTW